MNFAELLKDTPCACGKTHSCAIKHVSVGSGILEEIPSVIAPFSRVLLVADKNTYRVCGASVKEKIEEKSPGKIENSLIYTDDLVIPNEDAIAKMQAFLTPETDLILGVGSGVIQDLCKYVSFFASIPYGIVATAPSMDGYASVGAAMITQNMKVTYSAHVPYAIFGDVDVLRDAPMEMIQAGYGDILGKFSCLNDWKLSHVVNDEFFCTSIYDFTYEMLMKTKDIGPALLHRETDAIQTLTEALIGVGIAMAYSGNSRPASGSEHTLSHFFEIVGILRDEPYFPHGTDVAFSMIYTQRMREELLKMEKPTAKPFVREAWESDIRRIYGRAAEGVIALQDKTGHYEKDYASIYVEKWEEIRNVLREVPSSEVLLEYLRSVGLNIDDCERLYGTEKLKEAFFYAKDLKDRYTVLWMYYWLAR
ncbi:MAG: sn-glycerol-1-phosphate dehydrogenase [Planctomycetia bacterium]|nr:sn-glycerol-1-phosphate dehydrogenase [Planctomycetia bacterium]